MANPGDSLLEAPPNRRVGESLPQVACADPAAVGYPASDRHHPQNFTARRLRENAAIFDFELTSAEMTAIGHLDLGRRFNDPGDFCETAFHTFFPIYE